VSANSSYQHTSKDIELFTGMNVSAKTQQRLVQRYQFELPTVSEVNNTCEVVSAPEPVGTCEAIGVSNAVNIPNIVGEVSLDGGMVRLVPPPGVKLDQPLWHQYKAVCLDPMGYRAAWFDDNESLVKWVKEQPLTQPVICLGDGHDGIWKVFSQIAPAEQRYEILDWYHLMENLEKIPEIPEQLLKARQLLWQGNVGETLALFESSQHDQARCFCQYLQKHRHRIPNYDYLQSEGIGSIGSGAVESTVKQIDRRLQISGARWEPKNVPQLLAHRCAYLNDLL